MIEILVILGFVAMVLTPCGVALYNRRDRTPEASEEELPPAPAKIQQPEPVQPTTPAPIQHEGTVAEVWAAQVAAAQATAQALNEASRIAAQRAEVAARAAEAAHRELTMAHQAAQELRNARKKIKPELDSLPSDHLSLNPDPNRSKHAAA
jgi:hypothetical protein